MKGKFFIPVAIIAILFFSCRKYCYVTGEYRYYNCPKGYSDDVSYSFFPYISYDFDSCAIETEIVGSFGSVCTVIVNDSLTFKQILFNDLWYDSIDFHNNTLVGLDFGTNQGSSLYYKEFVCVNHSKKKYIIRVQYELESQCAGSSISYRGKILWFKLPKITDEYEIIISVEDVNPFPD